MHIGVDKLIHDEFHFALLIVVGKQDKDRLACICCVVNVAAFDKIRTI